MCVVVLRSKNVFLQLVVSEVNSVFYETEDV
jgi:hypothetical protein